MVVSYPPSVFSPRYSRSIRTSTTYTSSHPTSAITLRSGRRLPPRGKVRANMDKLPIELLEMILMWDVCMCRSEKNAVLPLRLVSKKFDQALRPYIFKTMQLEFSRFAQEKGRPDVQAIQRVGELCNAVYIDMMVIRDEEEINRLAQIFQGVIGRVPEMTILLDSLRKYCMNEHTFDETDFKRVTDLVLQSTPNMTRLKVNLPFQVVGLASQTATLLLANTLAAVAQRPAEFKKIETLVLDHVSDTTINTLGTNPFDMANALHTFTSLKNLVLSVKRQEYRQENMRRFIAHLWFLISKARILETLCFFGWNVKRDGKTRLHQPTITFNEWMMRSFPYDLSIEAPPSQLLHLRCLELKRVDIDPRALENLLESVRSSLKELYLNEVYLKVFGSSDMERTSLWIGHGAKVQKPDRCIWLAQNLRTMEGLKLEVLRATGLGYDDFDPDKASAYPNYDLDDPTKLDRSFDQRFVEAVLGIDVDMTDASTSDVEVGAASPESLPDSDHLPALQHDAHTALNPNTSTPPHMSPLEPSSPSAIAIEGSSSFLKPRRDSSNRVQKIRTKIDYDAETYQRYRNVTSHFKRCIDGWFTNHNEQALKELQKIITVADRGMTLLSEEIERTHSVARAALNQDGAPGG